MDVIKKNLVIRFAYKMNEIELPVCVVTELWTRRLWFPASDYDRHMKRVDIACGMYFANTVSEVYGGLKSFQTVTSFQPRRSLSFHIFFGFLLCIAPKITQPIWYKWIIYK